MYFALLEQSHSSLSRGLVLVQEGEEMALVSLAMRFAVPLTVTFPSMVAYIQFAPSAAESLEPSDLIPALTECGVGILALDASHCGAICGSFGFAHSACYVFDSANS